MNFLMYRCSYVLSGMPQGSILGSVLFAIYINDLPEFVNSSTLYLFADNTKCFKLINTPEDVIKLQSDIFIMYLTGVII